MDEEKVRKIIREELKDLLGFYKYTFQHDLDIFDRKNIKLGSTVGTKIGTEATQKLAFYGETPIIQQSTFTVATGGVVQDAGARTNLASIKTILTNIGITN